MPPLLDDLVSFDNLFWAWEKVRRYYQAVDTWSDEVRIHAFESRLSQELRSISLDLAAGKYKTVPLRLLPQPKRSPSDEPPQIRQAFWVDVRDQVATVAYVNVVGAGLDRQMPTWSYGNRLHRSLRLVESLGRERTNIGPYRNSSGQIYRGFQQSWPLFKRHVVLSLRKMCGRGVELADDAERTILDREDFLTDEYRLPYLRDGFWRNTTDTPVWASLDIERFYPSLSLNLIRSQLLSHSESAKELGAELLDSLTRFELDLSGWSSASLKKMHLIAKQKNYSRLPTGLMVAGFLANVGLLDLDNWVSERILRRQVAHFRYVDDHVVLAQDVDSLVNWITAYMDHLEQTTGCNINKKKFEPAEFGQYLKERSPKALSKISSKLQLDPEFPIPLMTTTLAKVSDIAKTNFDLLPQGGQRKLLDDLEHLLLAPLPESELAEKTRVTFAAGKIARLSPRHERAADEYLAAWKEVLELDAEVKGLDLELKSLIRKSAKATKLKALRRSRRFQQRVAIKRFETEKARIDDARQKELSRVFKVLMRAVRQQQDKLRMWERILQFARFSGVPHVDPIISAIDDIAETNPLAAAMIRARVLQVHARNVVVCAKGALDSDSTHENRIAAVRYLLDIFSPGKLRALTTLRSPRYYERQSRDLLLFALDLTREMINTSAEPRDLNLLSEWRALSSLLKRRMKSKQRALPIGLLWWREKTLYHLSVKLDSSRSLSAGLSPADPASWLIWECRPEFVPLSALGAVLSGETRLDRGAEGSFRDMLADKSRTSRRRVLSGLRPKDQSRAATVLRNAKSTHTLFEWAGWTNELKNQFDPRVSEWTVLVIGKQICSLLNNKSLSLRRRVRIASHPANFTVPSSWWNPLREYGWKDWESTARQEPIRIRSSIIPDFRVAAALGIFPDAPTEFELVRAIGATLFGLLRRNFRWPMPWRVLGLQATLRGSIQAFLAGRPCSSRTLAILESTLLARSYESWLLKERGLDEQSFKNDIADDPPDIISLADLEKAIDKSMHTLSSYRLTVSELKPRQLIPLRVAQYTRSTWETDDESGRGAE